MRKGLAKSKNMISIRILKSIGPAYAQQWIKRFGFDADKHPAYLPMALGSGAVTPLQMASAYSVFANGGYRVNPLLISRITDSKGHVINEARVPTLDESARTIESRNAFVMTSLLQEVTHSGTAAKAGATLKRPDIYGKTGTTNDSHDAWFAGWQKNIVAVVWMGYDDPRKLGDRETGGGLALPVWIDYMTAAPCSLQSRFRSEMICAWIETSSAVVGSSATISLGSPASARAITTRCRMPPENWCGYWSRRSSAAGMPVS